MGTENDKSRVYKIDESWVGPRVKGRRWWSKLIVTSPTFKLLASSWWKFLTRLTNTGNIHQLTVVVSTHEHQIQRKYCHQHDQRCYYYCPYWMDVNFHGSLSMHEAKYSHMCRCCLVLSYESTRIDQQHPKTKIIRPIGIKMHFAGLSELNAAFYILHWLSFTEMQKCQFPSK